MTAEPVINGRGETIAVLERAPNGPGSRWAKIDNGTLETLPNGEVKVSLQNRRTAEVTCYQMGSIVEAFYALGLSAERCNGIDGWLGMALMPGTAGSD